MLKSLSQMRGRAHLNLLPLWSLSIALLLGVVAAMAGLALLVPLAWLWGVVLVPSVLLWLAPALRQVAWWLLALSLGVILGAHAVWQVRAGWLDPALELQPAQVDVRVVGLPEVGERGTAWFAQVVTPPHGLQHFPQRLRLHWYKSPPPLNPGELWRVKLRLKRPHGSVNGVGLDYEAWLFRQGVQATGTVMSGERLQTAPDWSVDGVRADLRQRLLDVMAGEPSAGLVLGLVLGDRSLMSAAQWDVLLATGTNHLLAISGLHVTMIAGMVWWLVASVWRRVPRLALILPASMAGACAGLLAAFAYSLLAGFSVPTQRTLFMLLALVMALLARRQLVARDVLGLALLLVLLWDARSVLDVGFWLSFAAVGVLIYAASGRLQTLPAWRELGLAQWAVFVGLLPLTLLLFQRGSWVAPLANLLAIPWVSFWVTPLALLGSVLLGVSHTLGSAVLWVALRSLDGLMDLLQRLATLPGAQWFPAMPPWPAFVLAAFGVFWLLAPRGVPLRGMAWVLFLPLFFPRLEHPAPGELWLDWLDVGQGQAVLARTTHHSMLYDAGPVNFAGRDAGREVVVPVLRSEGVPRVDVLLLSNGDRDHAGGAEMIRQSLPVGGVWSGGDAVSHAELCRQGLHWSWDGVDFRALHPPIDWRAGKDNDASCVLKISAPGGRVLLTGDIERAAEWALLHSGEDLAAEVMQVPHHGSKTSSDPRLIAAVAPKIAVVSAGYRNAFRHPRAEVIARYVQQGAQVVDTPSCGRMQIRLQSGQPLEMHCARDAWPWAWRVPHASVAGQIEVDNE